MPRLTCRVFLLAGALAAANLALPAHAAEADTVRIGYQKYGTLVLLKAKGTLEARLKPLGVAVKWTEFPAGPQLLEGLNVGSIDIGTTGEAPPIFAQAAGADLVYIGNEPPAPSAEALVVPKQSAIRSVADLKGKKIALNKGSNVHYLLVKVLEKHGLKYSDVQTVYLPPADARAAFERGSVDAWAIWDPFLAAAEKQIGARVLADGRGIVSNHQFYFARRGFAQQAPKVVSAVLEELDKIDQWGKAHPREVSQDLAREVGLPLPVTELSTARYSFGVTPISPAVLQEQQKIADTFHQLGLIPKPLRVADAAVKPVAPAKK